MPSKANEPTVPPEELPPPHRVGCKPAPPVTRKPVAIPTLIDDTPGPLGVLHTAFLREIVNPSGPDQPEHPAIGTFCAIVDGVINNEDISTRKDEINRAMSNQPEKVMAVMAGLRDVQMNWLKEWVITLNFSQQSIHRLCRNSGLSSTEFLAVFNVAYNVLDKLARGIGDNVPQLDSLTITEKLDFKKQQAEKIVRQQYAGTTPQGMEIIRKKLYALEKQVSKHLHATPI